MSVCTSVDNAEKQLGGFQQISLQTYQLDQYRNILNIKSRLPTNQFLLKIKTDLTIYNQMWVIKSPRGLFYNLTFSSSN